jgi:6-pyruvoyltetrahydropterin/6-carboxytetrahydropterin synthase
MEIFKKFTIEAAHRLPNLPEGHKCGRLHGHSWGIEIHVRGDVGEETGWVVDYREIEEAFLPLLERLDHSYLNELEGLANPTSENLARWVWRRLCPALPLLSKVVVWETSTSGSSYEGEED